MRLQNVILLVAGVAVMMLFQNCGDDVTFSAEPGLTKVNTAGNEQLGDGGGQDEEVVDTTNEDDADDVADGDDPANEDPVDDTAEEGDDGAGEEVAEEELSDVADGQFVCILEGPGKSIKVGYLNEELAAKNATPQVVCMSEMACRDLISKKFTVKAVGKRGFCPNKNKHVVPLSDKQISELVK